MNYTRNFLCLAFGLITLTAASAQTPTTQGYDTRDGSYNPRDRSYDTRDYGSNRDDRGYYGDSDWRNRRWDNHPFDDFHTTDHEFWRGRWRDELNLTRSQRRDMERIDDYYDRFRIDTRDPRFRQVQRQKFGDMLSVMTPQQRNYVLDRVQPPRGQYGRRGYDNRGYDRYGRPVPPYSGGR